QKRVRYDAQGRVTEAAYFDEEGQPTLHRDGYIRSTARYDEQGNRAEQVYFGLDDRPVQTRVMIVGVPPETQGSWLGLQPGDVVLAYNGQPIRFVFEFLQARKGESWVDPPRTLVVLRG